MGTWLGWPERKSLPQVKVAFIISLAPCTLAFYGDKNLSPWHTTDGHKDVD